MLSESDALNFARTLRETRDEYLSVISDMLSTQREVPWQAAELCLSMKGIVAETMLKRRTDLDGQQDAPTLALLRRLRHLKIEVSRAWTGAIGNQDAEAYDLYIDSLNSAIDSTETTIARRTGLTRDSVRDWRIGLHDLASVLPVHSVLLEYIRFVYRDCYGQDDRPAYLVTMVRDNGWCRVLPVTGAELLDSLIWAYQAHMQTIGSSEHLPLRADREAYDSIGRGIYRVALSAADSLLRPDDLLIVAPDGPLNRLSFGTTLTPSGSYLIERYPIQYLCTCRDLLKSTQGASHGRGMLVIADPDFWEDSVHQPQHSAIRSLRQSRQEAELVAKTWREVTSDSVTILLGPEASEAGFRRAAPGSRLIHISTHGLRIGSEPIAGTAQGSGWLELVSPVNPMATSGLLMAGAGRLFESRHDCIEEGDDGYLSALEVSTLNLQGTDLVVLSACETGLGVAQEGEGVYGLRRAFLIAGARMVVSSLWPVPDQSTADMMRVLYSDSEQLLPERLRLMQVDQIEKLRVEGLPDHPYSWGAFVVSSGN